MDVGEIYHNSNKVQALYSSSCINLIKKFLIEKFGNQKCKFLDIGTGDGRVLSEVFVKQSGLNFEKVLGSDINLEMIKVAKKNYQNDLIKFEQLNIEDEEASSEFFKVHGTFDIVTSYFCLHWIKDLKIALSNVKRFLKPNGVFHFIVVTKCSSTPAFVKSLNYSKYDAYKNNFFDYPPIKYYCKNENINEIIMKTLDDLGFKIKTSESILSIFDCETEDGLKNFFTIFPFIKKMPENLREEYLNDFTEELREINKQRGLLNYEVEATFLNCLVIKKEC